MQKRPQKWRGGDRKMRLTGIIFGCLILSSALLSTPSGARDGLPSRDIMRAHIVSKLSDEQLLSMWEQAKKISEDEREMRKQEIAESASRMAEKRKRCSDVAYKVRNKGSCMPGYITSPPPARNADRIMEDLIMGMCNYVHTMADARKFGCIP